MGERGGDRRAWVCQVLCVNDLDFVVGFGFGFGFGVVLGFGFVLGVVVGFGDGLQGKGCPLPLHIHVEEFEIALCHPTGLGHAVWPQDGEVI